LESKVFVALSRFTIANGMSASVREAFLNRPHVVDGEPGFLGLSVMSPVDRPEEIWLLTRWLDEPSYRAWHGGHTYHNAHAGIPKGLKLVPKSADVSFFDAFAD
jgi:heme-degrading monooxygenase HmoA